MAQTKSIPPPPLIVLAPVLEKYKLYEDKGKIYFVREWGRYGNGLGQRRHFAYTIASGELWRVYARNHKPYKRVPSWHAPQNYIQAHRLEPVMPKHLRLDTGL